MKPDTNHVSTGKTGQTFWMRLTEPHVSIPEAERQRVRLTAALSLALMLTSAAAVPGQFLLGSLTSDVWTVLAATASLVAAYALSRSPRAGLAVWFVLFPILSAP
ncbi:MAG: hypothetical protein HND47_24240 [Chloroflexi bacterium]|nr:hypothetical protein [Chloroflexota bacterium]